jgi:hypothetical protein
LVESVTVSLMPQRYRFAAVLGPAVVIAAVGAVTIIDVRRAAEADRWVTHTIEVHASVA